MSITLNWITQDSITNSNTYLLPQSIFVMAVLLISSIWSYKEIKTKMNLVTFTTNIHVPTKLDSV